VNKCVPLVSGFFVGSVGAATYISNNKKSKNIEILSSSNKLEASNSIKDRITDEPKSIDFFKKAREIVSSVLNKGVSYSQPLDPKVNNAAKQQEEIAKIASMSSEEKKLFLTNKANLKIALLEAEIDQLEKKYLKVEQDIVSYTQEQDLFTAADITEARLSNCIKDFEVRKHVVSLYKFLARNNLLNLLNLPKEELYQYRGGVDGIVHPALEGFPEKFYAERTNFNFGCVIEEIRLLRSGNLNDIRKDKATKELESIKDKIKSKVTCADEVRGVLDLKLDFVDKKPEDFLPGDFSFMTDRMSRELVKSAYEVVTRLDKWAVFDQEPSEGSYMFCSDPEIVELCNEINKAYGGHSGFSMAWTMRQLQFIHNNGWLTYVNNKLEGIFLN
jgi:hypothetical protein